MEEAFPNLPLSPSRTFGGTENKRMRSPNLSASGSSKKGKGRQLSETQIYFEKNKRKAVALCRYLQDNKVIADCDDLPGLKAFIERGKEVESSRMDSIAAQVEEEHLRLAAIFRDHMENLHKAMEKSDKVQEANRIEFDRNADMLAELQETRGIVDAAKTRHDAAIVKLERELIKFTNEHHAHIIECDINLLLIKDKEAHLSALVRKWEGRREHGKGEDSCFCTKCAMTCT